LTIKFTRHTAALSRNCHSERSEESAFLAIGRVLRVSHHTPRKFYGPRSCSSHARSSSVILCALCG